MKSTPRLSLLILTSLFLLTSSYGQLKESIERNALLLRMLDGCLEGYDGAISGGVISYPRLREDRPDALITRATTGTMAIEWKSASVPFQLSGKEVTFVVSAGILTRPGIALKFELSINNVPRVTFSSTDTLSWQAGEPGGVRLRFDGAMRDQHTDAFGYLRIHVPANLIAPGEPVRFKIVGENAGSSGWFMVFKDGEVLSYLKNRVACEAFCDLSIEPAGKRYAASLIVPTTWMDNRMSYSIGESDSRPVVLTRQNDTIPPTFSFEAKKTDRFRLFLDRELIIDIEGLFHDVNETRVFSEKLVSLRSRTTPTGGWGLEYQSMYAPQVGKSLVELSDSTKGRGEVHFIISTHQDIAWMDSPEQCIKDRDEKILTPTLAIMKEDSNYHFDLEDVLFLREYLERHPERKDDLRKFMLDGQLGIGAAYNQPYEDLSSGEMLIREFYAGRKWLRRNFPGCDTRIYWNTDVPGRTAQMPQIMHKAGVQYLFISRFEKGLYDWLSPDGSSVLTLSPGHYGDFAERVGRKGFPEITGYIASFASDWSSVIKNGSRNIPIVSMSDMSTPVRYDDVINKWNGARSIVAQNGSSQPLTIPFMHYSSAQQFFDSVTAEHLQLPSVQGERPNIWLYIHGPTHHWAISAKREADVYLPAAETFSTINALLDKSFSQYPQRELTAAWEAQLYPDHGWGGKNGEITDSTFRAKFEYARDVSKRVYSRATSAIAARVRTTKNKGIPLVVFNNLSWKRTGPVQLTATFPQGSFQRGFTLNDAAGRPLPCQILSLTNYPDGSIESAGIVFIAEDVPPVGYLTYYIRHSPNVVRPDTSSSIQSDLLNKYYKIHLVPGGIRQIVDVELRQDLLSTDKFLGGELFTMQSVGEDAGEWSEPQQPSMKGFDKLSNYRPVWQLVESGPVRQVVETRQDVGHTTVVQRVILYNILKQIDFETSLLKWDGTKYREFRLAFPMKMQNGQVAYEVPFGTVEVGKDEMKGAAGERYQTAAASIRPRSIQNWIAVSGDDVGVTIGSSVAVWDYRDPTDQPINSPMLQPVLLASRRSCHGLGPWYLQEADHFYRFSLTSYRPGWRNGRRFGVAANNPLTVVFNPVPLAKPILPEQRSFFSISSENAVLSTMKKCEDDDNVVLRLYEDAGKNGSVRLRFPALMQRAQSTNIIEEEGIPAWFKLDELLFPLMHWSILTFKVTPKLD